MNELKLNPNPETRQDNNLFEACLAYNRALLALENEKSEFKIVKAEYKKACKGLEPLYGKNTIVTRTDSEDKVELWWEEKVTKGNPEPKPTQDKVKFIPRVKTVE